MFATFLPSCQDPNLLDFHSFDRNILINVAFSPLIQTRTKLVVTNLVIVGLVKFHPYLNFFNRVISIVLEYMLVVILLPPFMLTWWIFSLLRCFSIWFHFPCCLEIFGGIHNHVDCILDTPQLQIWFHHLVRISLINDLVEILKSCDCLV